MIWDSLENHANSVQITISWRRYARRKRRTRVCIQCCANTARVPNTVVQVQVKLFGKFAWNLRHANLGTASRHSGNLYLRRSGGAYANSAIICIEGR